MLIFEKNLLKLNNGQYAQFSHRDTWGMLIFTFENGKQHGLLDDEEFCKLTSFSGEPADPLEEELQPKNLDLFDRADKDTQGVLTLEEWENYFEPILCEDGDYKTFPSFNNACEYIEHENLPKNPYQHIWSIIDGDDGKLILLNGYHKINVLDYLVCETAWGLGTDSDKDVYLEIAYEE